MATKLLSKSTRPRTAAIALDSDDEPLSDAVYQRLLEGILTGRHTPGTVLSELGVARELGVSRTPVHDALRQLAKDGLVCRERNCRARVAGITVDDVFEIFEMRKILEGQAAEFAAGRMDRRQLAPLRNAADDLQLNSSRRDWTAKWADFDDQFHSAIADASGIARLARDIKRYRLLHKGFNRFATEPVCLQQALREHLEILAALEAKDGKLARQRMTEHISVWQDFFIRNIPATGTARVGAAISPFMKEKAARK